jgi:hypothetical protein
LPATELCAEAAAPFVDYCDAIHSTLADMTQLNEAAMIYRIQRGGLTDTATT